MGKLAVVEISLCFGKSPTTVETIILKFSFVFEAIRMRESVTMLVSILKLANKADHPLLFVSVILSDNTFAVEVIFYPLSFFPYNDGSFFFNRLGNIVSRALAIEFVFLPIALPDDEASI